MEEFALPLQNITQMYDDNDQRNICEKNACIPQYCKETPSDDTVVGSSKFSVTQMSYTVNSEHIVAICAENVDSGDMSVDISNFNATSPVSSHLNDTSDINYSNIYISDVDQCSEIMMITLEEPVEYLCDAVTNNTYKTIPICLDSTNKNICNTNTELFDSLAINRMDISNSFAMESRTPELTIETRIPETSVETVTFSTMETIIPETTKEMRTFSTTMETKMAETTMVTESLTTIRARTPGTTMQTRISTKKTMETRTPVIPMKTRTTALETDCESYSDDSGTSDLDTTGSDFESEMFSSMSSQSTTPRSDRICKPRRGNFACDVPGCDRKFSRPDRLEQHSRIHTGARPYVCPESSCGRSYTRSQHLKRHQQVTHAVAPPQASEDSRCKECDKQLSSVYNLRKHQTQIHARRKHSCSECGMMFLKPQHLRTHYQIHTSQHAYECDHPGCKASFVNPSKLMRHMQVHLPGRYKCTRDSNCEEVFDRHIDLRKHVMHDHPYTCDVCGVEFTQLKRYNAHCLTHQDERLTFHCMKEGCGRCYYTLRDFTSHIRDKHDGDGMLFSCRRCDHTFVTKQKLQIHQKVHSRDCSALPRPKKHRTPRHDKGIGRTNYRKLLAGIPEHEYPHISSHDDTVANETKLCTSTADATSNVAYNGSGLQSYERENGFEQVIGTLRLLQGSADARRNFNNPAINSSAISPSEYRLNGNEISSNNLHNYQSVEMQQPISKAASTDTLSERTVNIDESNVEISEEATPISSCRGEKIGNVFISGVGALKESRVMLTKLSDGVVRMLDQIRLADK